MDSWSRFQHLISSELWGHRDVTGPGRAKTGPSAIAAGQEKPFRKAKA